MIDTDCCIKGGDKRTEYRCILCNRVIKDFDEFAPFYECDTCRRKIIRKIK